MNLEPTPADRRDLPFGHEMPAPAFHTLIIDVDTLMPDLECFSWLAQRRGDIVARRCSELAAEFERGAITSAQFYRERLALIRPRRTDLDALAAAYVAQLPPRVADAVRRFKRHGVQVVLASSGLRHALLRLGARLELDLSDIHGIDVRFDALGAMTTFDAMSPLVQPNGKSALFAGLGVDAPVLYAESLSQIASLA